MSCPVPRVFGDIFYDINLEVDQFLPHAKGASEINGSTSSNKRVTQPNPKVNKNSERTKDSVSNRSLLANALEGVAKTDLMCIPHQRFPN